jgi:hypothetical protein
MSLGAFLVGITALLLAIAYIARPFRRIDVDLDQVIERWIRQERDKLTGNDSNISEIYPDDEVYVDEAVVSLQQGPEVDITTTLNFCPYCGRRVEPDHRYCPGCGRQLVKEAES